MKYFGVLGGCNCRHLQWSSPPGFSTKQLQVPAVCDIHVKHDVLIFSNGDHVRLVKVYLLVLVLSLQCLKASRLVPHLSVLFVTKLHCRVLYLWDPYPLLIICHCVTSFINVCLLILFTPGFIFIFRCSHALPGDKPWAVAIAAAGILYQLLYICCLCHRNAQSTRCQSFELCCAFGMFINANGNN